MEDDGEKEVLSVDRSSQIANFLEDAWIAMDTVGNTTHDILRVDDGFLVFFYFLFLCRRTGMRTTAID